MAVGVFCSNYRALRDTGNRYWINGYLWIDWAPNQIKFNNGTRNTLIGTDGNDVFDASYYRNYSAWFPTVLTNFMAGGGDDQVGGSTGNGSIWGGTGNDTRYVEVASSEVMQKSWQQAA